jgi:hypothetical protein
MEMVMKQYVADGHVACACTATQLRLSFELLVPAVCPPTPVHINKPLLSVATSSATSSHTNCDRRSQDSARFASSSSHHGQPRTRYALCGRQRPNNESRNGEHPRPCHPLGTWTRDGIHVRWAAVVVQMVHIKDTG